jgi:hypothetical protein
LFLAKPVLSSELYIAPFFKTYEISGREGGDGRKGRGGR